MRFTLFALMLLPAFAQASPVRLRLPPVAAVIYGTDDRMEVFEAPANIQVLAQSTAGKVFRENLTETAPGTFALSHLDHGTNANLCESERFRDQPAGMECSGFLVGPDLLATAGHCVDDQLDCDNTSWVFGYQLDRTTRKAPVSFQSKDVYQCKRIVSRRLESDGELTDYALVQLERIVPDRAPLKFRTEGKVADRALLTMIGTGAKIPTKVVRGGRINDNSPRAFFTSNLDSFTGNSGSAVFNQQTWEVEGIMVRGEEDYVFDHQRGCGVVNVCPPEGCNPEANLKGEDATRITVIPELSQQQKVLNAAFTGDADVIQSYLDNGAWIDIYDHQRESMLFKAIQGNQQGILSLLIERGADVNATDLSGNSALHVAVARKNRQAVELLLAAGADAGLRNQQGQRAIDLCRWHSLKQRKIRSLLLRAQ